MEGPMTFARRIFMTGIAIAVLTSCGYMQRQKLMEEKYPKYPDEIKRAIDGGYLIEGMNKEQVYLALGTTLCVSSTTQSQIRVELWSYQPEIFSNKPTDGTFECHKASMRVYFVNGVVTRWDNMPF
jgi:hypothetical protein